MPTGSRSTRLWAVAVFSALLVLGTFGAAGTATVAHAANVGAVTGVTSSPDPGGVPSGTTIGVGVVVSVPDAAKVGDTFSLTLDSHVVGMSNSFDMKDPHGAIIAQCVVAARAVTCTYTNYVETHSDITATLSFTVVGRDVTNGSGLKWIDEAVKSSEREPRSLRSTEAFPTNSISCTRSTRMGPLRIG